MFVICNRSEHPTVELKCLEYLTTSVRGVRALQTGNWGLREPTESTD